MKKIQVLFMFVLVLFWRSDGIIINYAQNKRGGRVKLHSIIEPPSEFDHAEKGDALYGKIVNFYIFYMLICFYLLCQHLYILDNFL